ncbi:hypothetical protein COLO4_35888 [Corchorus olitorius]|uniref:Uncharacterized protein n=1 Tax=Corchorus olitorius TaxID=93759 RepID=A0A1R3GC85_9ROSI|nr:hypothetical protein COLO4_35888 [Corchorus olitorius]
MQLKKLDCQESQHPSSLKYPREEKKHFIVRSSNGFSESQGEVSHQSNGTYAGVVIGNDRNKVQSQPDNNLVGIDEKGKYTSSIVNLPVLDAQVFNPIKKDLCDVGVITCYVRPLDEAARKAISISFDRKLPVQRRLPEKGIDSDASDSSSSKSIDDSMPCMFDVGDINEDVGFGNISFNEAETQFGLTPLDINGYFEMGQNLSIVELLGGLAHSFGPTYAVEQDGLDTTNKFNEELTCQNNEMVVYEGPLGHSDVSHCLSLSLLSLRAKALLNLVLTSGIRSQFPFKAVARNP